MVAENPLGFGTGKSGEAYMQWYQPLEAMTGYRTMVNSYLTFLVEQGWFWFAIVLCAIFLFWFWCVPEKPVSAAYGISTGLRASILAFAVSGIFSTVMEEPILWIIPGCCAAALIAWALLRRVPLTKKQTAQAAFTVIFFCGFLYTAGLVESHTDPLAREFASSSQGHTVSKLVPKHSTSAGPAWTVVPDVEVLGPEYGKLLRQLVLETGITLTISDGAILQTPVPHFLVVGSAIKNVPVISTSGTILLSPAAISEAEAATWLNSSPRLTILNPGIDEDRRALFWRKYISSSNASNITVQTLSGVGLRVDWAWEDVIATIKGS